MIKTDIIYNVIGVNHFHTVTYDSLFMEKEIAYQVYDILMHCKDCESGAIIDATTGEILINFDINK